MAYKTPGVYVEEISTLPPSVAEVSTAVPAFLGATEKGPSIARINTLLEYTELFGGPKPSSFRIQTGVDPQTGLKTVQSVEHAGAAPHPAFLMYYCLSHYFKNGGGSCYVVSVGKYDSAPDKAGYEAGLALLEKEDEPTIIVLTDAVNLAQADYFSVCQQALAQCSKLGDRFAVLDVQDGKVDDFRNQIGTSDLKYGAAYYPYLKTSLNYHYEETGIEIQGEVSAATFRTTIGGDGIVVDYVGAGGDTPKARTLLGAAADPVGFGIEGGDTLRIENVRDKTGAQIVAAWGAWKAANDARGFDVTQNGDGTGAVTNVTQDLALQGGGASSLASLKTSETALHSQIKIAMAAQRVTLPPSAAIAGIYARVDRERGVWKAPANVSLSSVIAPVTKTTHEAQEGLNVDPTAGKSINAIREFTGKGILVWGARTLAGNDNEWRYVPVRRLFNFIEESSRKATSFAVFEPNDATTWLKVKGMLESFLYSLWERGALAGATPDAAYFVNVGLGKTMTPQDVLEGRMVVEIGVAAVRPAEFIILRFTHKLQEA